MAEQKNISETIATILLIAGVILMLSGYRACNDARNPVYRTNYSLGYQKENLGAQTAIYFLSGIISISLGILFLKWDEVEEKICLTFSKKKRFEKGQSEYELASYFANLDLSKSMKKIILDHLLNAIELNYDYKDKLKTDERFRNYWNDPDFIELVK